MSVEKAKEIAKFLEVNQIHYLNMMGGEFFCNPDWLEVLMELGLPDHVVYFRLVSNSDWYKSDKVKEGLLTLRDALGEKFHMSLSKDRWHTNVGVEEAKKWLDDNNILTIVATPDKTKPESIVPVGRAEWGYWGFFDMMGNSCSGEDEHYTFLIDEGALPCSWIPLLKIFRTTFWANVFLRLLTIRTYHIYDILTVLTMIGILFSHHNRVMSFRVSICCVTTALTLVFK